MGRETSDRGIAVSSAGPLESLVEPRAAIEVAILARMLLGIPISSDLTSPILISIPPGIAVRNHVDEMGGLCKHL